MEASYLYDFWLQDDGQDTGNLNVPRAQLGFATDDTGRVYALGGVNDEGQVLSSTERFDLANDEWVMMAPLPAARVGATAASDGQGHLFLFGGGTANTATSVSNTAYRYIVATNTWNAVAPLPAPVRESVAVAAPNGKIYLLGGVANGVASRQVQAYDYALNQWNLEPDLPAARSTASACSRSTATMLSDGEVVGPCCSPSA